MSETPESIVNELEENIHEIADGVEVQFKRLVDVFNPMNNKLNWLLLALPLTLYFNAVHSLQMAFVFSMIAIAPLAFLMGCLLYTSPSPRDATLSRMPSSA